MLGSRGQDLQRRLRGSLRPDRRICLDRRLEPERRQHKLLFINLHDDIGKNCRGETALRDGDYVVLRRWNIVKDVGAVRSSGLCLGEAGAGVDQANGGSGNQSSGGIDRAGDGGVLGSSPSVNAHHTNSQDKNEKMAMRPHRFAPLQGWVSPRQSEGICEILLKSRLTVKLILVLELSSYGELPPALCKCRDRIFGEPDCF